MTMTREEAVKVLRGLSASDCVALTRREYIALTLAIAALGPKPEPDWDALAIAIIAKWPPGNRHTRTTNLSGALKAALS